MRMRTSLLDREHGSTQNPTVRRFQGPDIGWSEKSRVPRDGCAGPRASLGRSRSDAEIPAQVVVSCRRSPRIAGNHPRLGDLPQMPEKSKETAAEKVRV